MVSTDPYGNEAGMITFSLPTNTANLKIVKKDAETGKAISGVTFTVTGSVDGNLGTHTTNSSGEILISGIHEQTVTVTEKTAKEGYVIDNTSKQVAVEYNKTASVTFNNTYKKGNLKIVKVDKDTGKVISGVTFSLTGSRDGYLGTYTTNEKGEIEVKNVNIQVITATETKTKNEYVLNTEPQKATIEWNKTSTLTFKNEYKKGNLKIVKVDQDTGAALSGITFSLTGSKDGNLGTYTTNSKGEIELKNVNIQVITATETKTKDEYILNTETQKITVEYNKTATLTIKNAHKKGNLKIIKLDEETGEALSGISFSLVGSKDGNLGTHTTNEKGEIELKNVNIQEITTTEVKTRDEYILNTEPQKITVKWNETVTLTFKNMHKKGDLKIIKIDEETGARLSGITFSLVGSYEGDLGLHTTNEEGEIELKDVNIQEITATEVDTREEYILNTEPQKINVKWNDTVTLTFKNMHKKGNLKILKLDLDTGEVLSGITFSLVGNYDGDLGVHTTNEKGEIELKDVNIQKITATEVKTRDEYILNTEPQKIDVIWNETVTLTFKNEHKKGNLKILKIDKDDNELTLGGIEFDLVYPNGKTYHLVTDADGIIELNYINIGKPVLIETRTKKEYRPIADRTVEIKWNETTDLTIENEKYKAQIEVYKTDAEDKEWKLSGIEFDIFDKNMKYIETITTNEEGYAITSKIPIGGTTGVLYAREKKTDELHVLDDTLIKVDMEADVVSTLNLTNERIKGQIEVYKTGSDDNFINGLKAGSPIKDVEYDVFDLEDNYITTLITDEKRTCYNRTNR